MLEGKIKKNNATTKFSKGITLDIIYSDFQQALMSSLVQWNS